MVIKVDKRTVIVFDLDDTLFNEIDYLRSAYIDIAKKVDYENWQLLFVKMFSLYRHKRDVFEMVSKSYGYKKADLLKLYREHSPSIEPSEGVIELLNSIKRKKGKIAVITDGRKVAQKAKLNALKIHEYFDKIIISEELGTEKPHLNNYLSVENAYPNHKYLYIADNLKKDFIQPNKLGWKSIGLVDSGLNIHHDAHLFSTKVYLPERFIFNLKEIEII